MFTLVILLGNEWSGGRDYVLIDSHERAARLIVLGLVPLIMTKFQVIIDTVLLGSMGLGGLSGVGRSNHVDSAEFYLKKLCVHCMLNTACRWNLWKKGGCTLIRNVR